MDLFWFLKKHLCHYEIVQTLYLYLNYRITHIYQNEK
jgi:hypothetical protein